MEKRDNASRLTRFSRCVSFAENRCSDETTSRLPQRQQTKAPPDHILLLLTLSVLALLSGSHGRYGNCTRWQFVWETSRITMVHRKKLRIPHENGFENGSESMKNCREDDEVSIVRNTAIIESVL